MRMKKSKIALYGIVLVVSIPVGLLLLLVSGGIYQSYYTKIIKTAFVSKVDDDYFITIRRMRPVGGHFELNPVRWFFPHIIETSMTLKVPGIEGKINGDRVSTRSESSGTFSTIYDGTIEFTGKKEMKIDFHCDKEISCREWNGDYELVLKD